LKVSDTDERNGRSTAEPDAAGHRGWRGLISADYDRAIVRMAIIERQQVRQLLFAWVELLPPEIPSPPESAYDPQTFKRTRLACCRIEMGLDEALAWYEAAWSGQVTWPRQTDGIGTSGITPEPPVKRFGLRTEPPPFSPGWHLTPRVHQLVAGQDQTGLVAELASGMATVEAFQRARIWLEERLHFDVLAHDAWFGSVVLVAPNPVMRRVGERIAAREGGAEIVEVNVLPRRGQDPSAMTVTFEERRGDADGLYQVSQLDPQGYATVRFEGMVAEHAIAISCPTRGLLHRTPQASFLRHVETYWVPPPSTKPITIPKRKAGRSETTQLAMITPRRPQRGEPPVSGLRRLAELEERQRRRFGVLRPLSVGPEARDTFIFKSDRGEAVAEIQRLIGRAEERVIFVDPFFSPPDVLQFATAIRREGIAIAMLVGRLESDPDKPPPGLPPGLTAEAWFEQVVAELAADSLLKPACVDLKVFADGGGFHDRFLVVDREVWLCGHSFNKVGDGEFSLMTRLSRPDETLSLILNQLTKARTYADWRAGRGRP
jgi:hypothetical protein